MNWETYLNKNWGMCKTFMKLTFFFCKLLGYRNWNFTLWELESFKNKYIPIGELLYLYQTIKAFYHVKIWVKYCYLKRQVVKQPPGFCWNSWNTNRCLKIVSQKHATKYFDVSDVFKCLSNWLLFDPPSGLNLKKNFRWENWYVS